METKIGLKNFSDAIGEIHSFDAKYKNVILRNNNIVIPYINLGLSNHPIYEGQSMKFIDYAYMVFIDVSYLKVYLKETCIVINRNMFDEVYYFGGEYLDHKVSIFNDMEICCKMVFMQTVQFSVLGEVDAMWIPYDTPNHLQNMDLKKVNDFFLHEYMPENVRLLVK